MNYNYSFSGTDVKAYASNVEGGNFHQLEALSTISIQVNEQKSPVRRLGRQHVTGFTRSIKTVAGTMVFVILNDHPLKELIADGNLYLNSRHVIDNINKKYQATNILPFNIKLIYQTEHSTYNTAEINVYGIEIISQSIVTSSNDMVTEMVIQFLAKDYKEFYHRGKERLAEDTINAEKEIVRQEDILNQMNLENIYNKEQLEAEAQREHQGLLDAYAKEKELENNIALGQKILNDYWGNKANSNNVTKAKRIQPENIFKLQENAQTQARTKQEYIKELENKKLNLLMTYDTLKMNPNAKPEILQGYENIINSINNELQKLRAI